MSGSLAASLFDISKGTVFGTRNLDKTAKGDIVRLGVAVGQFRNAAEKISEYDNLVGHKAKTFVKGIDKAAKQSNALGYVAKTTKLFSRFINPAICVSGGTKVLLADDKTSEAVKQTAALGTMFAFEGTARSILTEKGRRKLAQKAIGQNAVTKKLIHWGRKVDCLARRKNMPKCVKWLVPIATSLGFVGMSIAGYDIGARIGNTINDARKSKKKQVVVKSCDKTSNPMTMAQLTQVAKIAQPVQPKSLEFSA